MNRTWNELSVLITGCGSIGKRHAGVLRELGIRDLHACDPSSKAREEIRKQDSSIFLYDSYDEGLSVNPDAVLICTPPEMHVPMATQAVLAGCHVMCEKPVSDSDEGLEELSALAAESGKKFMVGLCFRYHDGIVKARKYLEEGRIGRLAVIRALMGEHLPSIRPDYRDLHVTHTSGAFDLMHDLDLALWFADSSVKNAYCVSGSRGDMGFIAPDTVDFLIEFDGPCTASVHLDFFQKPRRRQLELIGTRGVIIVDFAQWEECRLSIYEAAIADWRHEDIITKRNDMFLSEDYEFLYAAANNVPVRWTIDEGRKSLDVILQTQRPNR
jgi:predicted dehydrogenase